MALCQFAWYGDTSDTVQRRLIGHSTPKGIMGNLLQGSDPRNILFGFAQQTHDRGQLPGQLTTRLDRRVYSLPLGAPSNRTLAECFQAHGAGQQVAVSLIGPLFLIRLQCATDPGPRDSGDITLSHQLPVPGRTTPYRLRGLIHHDGRYTALVRWHEQWFHADGSQVVEFNLAKLARSPAKNLPYLLYECPDCARDISNDRPDLCRPCHNAVLTRLNGLRPSWWVSHPDATDWDHPMRYAATRPHPRNPHSPRPRHRTRRTRTDPPGSPPAPPCT